jgi:TP901 family phage tail tape measure protein
MASLGSVFVDVVAETAGFEETLENGLRAAISRTALGGVLGSTIALGVSKAIKEFLPLEREILRIFQVQGVDASAEMFDELANQIYGVARDIGKPAEAVGQAIALGIGRGFSQEESIELTQVAGQLSRALGQELPGSIAAITASLNGFGLSSKEAENAAALLFTTVDKAGVPIAQLAQQIGNVAPSARAANLSLDETTAAIATLVQGGATSAEATTQIRTAIIELSDSATIGGKVFQSISGKTFPQFIKEGGSLQDALNLMNTAAIKSGYSVSDLTGNYSTQNAIVALTGAATERYTQNLADNASATERMENALKSAEQGALFQFNDALNKVRTGVQEVGGAFRPLLDILLSKLTPAVDWVAGALSKVAQIVSEMDFTQAEAAINRFILLLTPFGQLFVALYNILSALNWNEIFAVITAAAAPALIAFALLSGAVKLLVEVLEFLTPVLRPVVDVVSYLAVGFAFAIALTKVWAAALVAVRVVMFVLGPLMRAVAVAARVLGVALRFMMNAATPLPLKILIVVVTSLVAAFAYAWKNSEKFRNIVVNAFNTVKDGVVSAIQFILKTMLILPRTWAAVADRTLAILEKLPDFLGGGKFSDARAGVQNIVRGLDAIENKINEVATAAKAMRWELEAATGSWFSDGVSQAGRTFPELLAAQQKAAKKAPKFTVPNTSGLGDLLNPQKDSAKKAKDTAAQTAKTIKNLLKGLYEEVVKFTKDIGEKSLDQIESGFDNIIEKYGDAIDQATELGQKKVVARLKASLKQIKSYDKQLSKLAGKKDMLDERIKTATDNLKSLTDAASSFRDSTRAAFIDLGKVSEASAGIGVTFLGIRNNLRDAIRTTTAFSTAFKKLQALGLNEASLRQLADAGPAALDQAMALARSGAGGIKEINRLQAELDKLATANSKNMTDEFFKMGVAQAQGLLKGLQSERSKLVKEMESLGAAMVKGMKKTLQIKSPSQVFDELGRQVPAGMAQGVRRGTPDVLSAIAAMTKNSNTGVDVGGITITGVSDPAAARRAGILAGDAIKATLSQRATAQTLAGVR